MTEESRHESEDLADYEVLDSSDSLDGPPGDDPLDRGVVTPSHWSAGMRYGTTAQEAQDGESLDQHLAEEEPDASPGYPGLDENATEEDIGRLARTDGPEPRAGRLAAQDEGAADEGAYLPGRDDLLAVDEGADGGGATAEEAAVHIEEDEG